MDNSREKFIKRNIIGMLIIAAICIAVVAIYKIKTAPPKQHYEEWTETEFGDIVVEQEEERIEEVPENITDAYGLEYEFIKLPSIGISTYKPVGWDCFYEDDFFYFTAPADSDNYDHLEIAICNMSIGSINNTYDRAFAQNYVQTNIKVHNTETLEAMLVTKNQYKAIKDGGELFAYYCAPEIQYTKIDQPEKGSWNPYTVVYMLNTDSDITTFCVVTGPRDYVMEVDEVAKTIAYNTKMYENTDFDFEELTKVHMKKQGIGNMFFFVKDTENVVNSNEQYKSLMPLEHTDNMYNLSNKLNSLAFNCKFVVNSHLLNKELDDFVDEEFMDLIWYRTSNVYDEGKFDIDSKNLKEGIYYIVDSVEKIHMHNKDARKVTWRIEINSDSPARIYTDSIMPKMYTTYLIPDKETVYSFTINYTKYQKYAANEYLDKTMQTVGFSE